MATQTYVNSVTLTDAAEFNKFDTAAYAALSGVAGTNTITATGPANLTLVATNPVLWFIPAATNTGATTLNITPSGGAALGAKNVFANGAACIGGELVIGVPVPVVYDGTQYNILSLGRSSGTSASTATFNGTGGSTGSLTRSWQKIGSVVTLHIPTAQATTGTSSTALVFDTALPAAIRPSAQTQQFPITGIQNNGGSIDAAGILTITTAGVITINRDGAATAFTDGASAGTTAGITITYFVG